MLKLLDTTIRDGSYVIDFQFNLKDVALISSVLDAAGVPLIEVGHGLGLRAGTKQGMKSPYSDDQYLAAIAESVRKNDWGVFFIPGIGEMEDIVTAARHGMDFVRIGTNVNEVAKSESFIKSSKDLGLYVSSNLMKTYALSAEEVAIEAKKTADYGSDIVCIVDSAGGMLPQDVETYFNAIRKETDIPIGFHGHNNLGMAMANTLKAVELGCEIVDTSVRGMGRSSGNTVTEIFLLLMRKQGQDLGVDTTQILNLAETMIDPLLKNYQQVNSIGIISGFAQFHSSFLSRVFEMAHKYHVDPRELIVKVSEYDRINAPKELIERLADEMAQNQEQKDIDINIPAPSAGVAKTDLLQGLNQVVSTAVSSAKKFKKQVVLNLVQTYREGDSSRVSPVIKEGDGFVVASAEAASLEAAKSMVDATAESVHWLLVDIGNINDWSKDLNAHLQSSDNSNKVLTYADIDVWSKSVVEKIKLLAAGDQAPQVAVLGDNILSARIKMLLDVIGMVSVESGASVVVCTEKGGSGPLQENASGLKVIDAIIGAFTEKELEALRNNGATVYRPDMGALIQSEIQSLISLKSQANSQGVTHGEIDGIAVAAKGVVAAKGTIIVDDLENPTTIVGVANGRGYLLSSDELSVAQADDRLKLELFIEKRKLISNLEY